MSEPTGAAASRWAADLAGWALPEDLLAAAPESPYGWPAGLFRRWNRVEEASDHKTVTASVIAQHLPTPGVLLDVGAGTGRVCLPFARLGHRVVAVERSDGMADALQQEAEALGPGTGSVQVVRASWPVGEPTPWSDRIDVAVSANVVYDVADIAAFVRRLDEVAPVIVVELTTEHPWSSLAPYYRALHDLDRPDGPTNRLFVDVVRETVGVEVEMTEWSRSAGMYFGSWDEILKFYSKRLLVGSDRYDELRGLLEPSVCWEAGRATIGQDRRLATVVWPSTR